MTGSEDKLKFIYKEGELPQEEQEREDFVPVPNGDSPDNYDKSDDEA